MVDEHFRPLQYICIDCMASGRLIHYDDGGILPIVFMNNKKIYVYTKYIVSVCLGSVAWSILLIITIKYGNDH